MRPTGIVFALALVASAATACGADVEFDDAPGWTWSLPAHFPEPVVPDDNPLTSAKVELGRRLFYDPTLSVTGELACASCHRQELAFTDGRAQAVGATGELTPRSAMSLANVAYNSRLTWANPLIEHLEDQALLPMFGEAPIEMGLGAVEDEVLATLRADAAYAPLFRAAFPDDAEPVDWAHITAAIASFERTLISADSPYDRYVAGDEGALSPAAQRGMALFLSERLECFHCHGGFDFTDSVTHAGAPTGELGYHNIGLYNVDGAGAYPAENTGLFELTGQASDMGRFRAPTLRNVAVTAPYMHDGSLPTLEAVVAHYARGGRHVEGGPNGGDGAESPLESELVAGFVLTPDEEADLIAFLEALTDESFLTNPAFSSPFDAAP